MEKNKSHEKIIEIIQEKGPRLPMQIAEELKMNSLFISAFLSELANQKRIKISHLKVGGSPLYFLTGQEKQLENYQKYLNKKESDAFLHLKKHKILKDSKQEPSIRVALRSMRDFALGFKRDEEIFWRYFLVSEEEVKKILEPKKTINHELEIDEDDESFEIGENVKIKIKPKENKIINKEIIKPKKEENEFKNPLIITEKKKPKKQKSEFVLKTLKFIKDKEFEIIKEEEYKPKEYNCIIKINSELGPINFLTLAKDKKTITEGDLRKLLSNAQLIPLPALMLYTKEISKKAQEFAEQYNNVLKIIKIND